MHFRSLLAAGTSGLAAQAFLIPEVNNFPTADNVLPTTINPNHQTLTLDCSTCPFALESSRNGAHEWISDVQSDLEMKFESDGQALKFNGVPFYPVTNPTLPPTLFVSQKMKDDQKTRSKGFDGNLRLSYSLEYQEKKMEENTLIVVLMTIMGLDGEMIRVDNIEVKAIKAADGKLILHSVTAVPVSPDAPDAKCDNILCRVFTKLVASVAKAKAGAKSAAHRIKCLCVNCIHRITGHKKQIQKGGKHALPAIPHRRPDGTFKLPTHIKFKPGQQAHANHHQHHKGFFGKMALVAWTTFRVVFVPILIGCAFGMAVSAVGMIIGQFVVYLWMKFRKTSPDPRYAPIVNEDKEEAPPAYQDLPTKMEAVSEKEVEITA